MKFFSRLAASALTGLALLGLTASSVKGHHVPKQHTFDKHYSAELLGFVASTGHAVYMGAEVCDKNPGLMGFADPRGALVICGANHKGDYEELADTIRHETIHLAQFCKGRKYGASSALLFPNNKLYFLGVATRHLHWNPHRYPERKWNAEAEARVLAHELDEREVGALLLKYCRGKE